MYQFKRKNGKEILRQESCLQEDGSELVLLKYPVLEQTDMVEHCFTTRLGGVSRGIFSSMNLSFSRGDESSAVEENFRRIAEALGTKPENFVFTDQTHTTNVRKITREDAGKGITKERDYRDVDGLITDEPGLVLSAFFADCVPLYFVDPVHRAIGLSHSGWRGTAERMGAVTLEAMEKAYGTQPKDVICAIGPSICQDCYEVSEDVAEKFPEEFYGREIVFDKGNGKYQLDLWRANRLILMKAGVLPEHIAMTDICTCCNEKLLFSHRASQGKRGNLGAFLTIKDNNFS